jgi:hypothetical protein
MSNVNPPNPTPPETEPQKAYGALVTLLGLLGLQFGLTDAEVTWAQEGVTAVATVIVPALVYIITNKPRRSR